MNRIISAIVLILAIVCVAIPGYTQDQEPVHPLPTGLTLYTLTSSYGDTLFYVDPNSSEMRPLIEFSENDRPVTLSWSPDGQYFALVNNLVGPLEEPDKLCIYTADGEEVSCQDLMLWYPDNYRFPISWHSDGKMISVLVRTDDVQPQLGQIDPETNTLQLGHILDLDDAELNMVYWSPTGDFVAYQTGPEWNDLRLFVLDVVTGALRILTVRSSENCMAWTSDGMHLGVVHNIWRQEEFPFLLKTDGLTVYDTSGHVVNHVYPIFEGQSVLGCPFAWSSDDSRIAYYSGFVTDANEINCGVFVSEIDNNEAELVAIDNQCYGVDSIAWSFDDTHLVIETRYNAYGDVRVYSMDGWMQVFDTTEGINLVDPSWQPKS